MCTSQVPWKGHSTNTDITTLRSRETTPWGYVTTQSYFRDTLLMAEMMPVTAGCEEDATPIRFYTAATTTGKACRYGLKCRLKNPRHWSAVSHPKDHPLVGTPIDTTKDWDKPQASARGVGCCHYFVCHSVFTPFRPAGM